MRKTAEKEHSIERSTGNVFEDIGFPKAEAERLRIMAELVIHIERFIETHGLTQAKAAKRLGVSQPRVSDLLRGQFHLFSIDSLVEMLAHAGIRVIVKTSRLRKAA